MELEEIYRQGMKDFDKFVIIFKILTEFLRFLLTFLAIRG